MRNDFFITRTIVPATKKIQQQKIIPSYMMVWLPVTHVTVNILSDFTHFYMAIMCVVLFVDAFICRPI